jgi:hypothetical protein
MLLSFRPSRFRSLSVFVLTGAVSFCGPSQSQTTRSTRSSSIAITNELVLRLVAAGISDDTIIAVIREAKSTHFDISASAIGNLQRNGVSRKVVAVMNLFSRRLGTADPCAEVNETRRLITEGQRAFPDLNPYDTYEVQNLEEAHARAQTKGFDCPYEPVLRPR